MKNTLPIVVEIKTRRKVGGKKKITKPLKLDIKNEKKSSGDGPSRMKYIIYIIFNMSTENDRDQIEFDPLPFFTVHCRRVF